MLEEVAGFLPVNAEPITGIIARMGEQVITTTTHVVGRELRSLREQRQLTQAQLADRSGVSQRSIRAIENGQSKRPHAGTMRSIASGLQLSGQEIAQLSGRGPSRSLTSLAKLLQVSPYVLATRLPGIHANAMFRGGWTSQFNYSRVDIGADGHFERTRTKRVITSLMPDLSHILKVCNYSRLPRDTAPTLTQLEGCSLSGQWFLADLQVAIYELELEQPVGKGQSATYGYTTDERLPAGQRQRGRVPDRVVAGSHCQVDLLRLELAFRGEQPRLIQPYWVSSKENRPVVGEPIQPGAAGVLRYEQRQMLPGRAYGFVWSW